MRVNTSQSRNRYEKVIFYLPPPISIVKINIMASTPVHEPTRAQLPPETGVAVPTPGSALSVLPDYSNVAAFKPERWRFWEAVDRFFLPIVLVGLGIMGLSVAKFRNWTEMVAYGPGNYVTWYLGYGLSITSVVLGCASAWATWRTTNYQRAKGPPDSGLREQIKAQSEQIGKEAESIGAIEAVEGAPSLQRINVRVRGELEAQWDEPLRALVDQPNSPLVQLLDRMQAPFAGGIADATWGRRGPTHWTIWPVANGVRLLASRAGCYARDGAAVSKEYATIVTATLVEVDGRHYVDQLGMEWRDPQDQVIVSKHPVMNSVIQARAPEQLRNVLARRNWNFSAPRLTATKMEDLQTTNEGTALVPTQFVAQTEAMRGTLQIADATINMTKVKTVAPVHRLLELQLGNNNPFITATELCMSELLLPQYARIVNAVTDRPIVVGARLHATSEEPRWTITPTGQGEGGPDQLEVSVQVRNDLKWSNGSRLIAPLNLSVTATLVRGPDNSVRLAGTLLRVTHARTRQTIWEQSIGMK
jgi:hypothetical protein